MSYYFECPACKQKIERLKGATRAGVLQHHFALGHGIEVIRSHELARLADEGELSEADIAELNQLMLPL